MMDILGHALWESLVISFFVFVALLTMDLLYARSQGKFATLIQRKPSTQYLLSALLGAVPGCEGAYFAVSLHTHGIISFGALLAAFVATTGDEAWVMLSRFPKDALWLSLILIGLGFAVGYIYDLIQKQRNNQHEHHCETEIFHPTVRFSLDHYLKVHIWSHLIKKHMIKIFLWTFAAIFLIEFAIHEYDLNAIISGKLIWVLLAAALIGMIPQSGPNLIFVTMYYEGTIPFSILFTNMVINSGHALLPLLSISLRDSILIKLIGFGCGLGLGIIFFLLGF